MSSMVDLENILAPVTLKDFVEVYWGKKPIYIPGDRGKFKDVYSLERFTNLLSRPTSVLGHPRVRAAFDKRGRATVTPVLMINPRDARTAYDAGATICAQRLDEHEPELADLVRRIKVRLGYPGEVHIHGYWGPHGQGFLPHFDARIATTLQIDGAKTWRYARRSAVPWPHDNASILAGKVVYDRKGPRDAWEVEMVPDAEAPLDEVKLQAGDVLCLPAGTIHEAEADGASFALNIVFNPLAIGDFVGGLLGREFTDRPEWRVVPPLSPNIAAPDRTDLGPRALTARLAEAIEYLTRLQNDPRALGLLAGMELAAQLTPASEAAVPSAPMTLETEVMASPNVIVASPVAEDPLILIVQGSKVEASGAIASVLRQILTSRSMTPARLAASGADRSTVVQTIAELERAGLVQRVATSAR